MTVVKFPGVTVESVLDSAKEAKLKSVIVLGFGHDEVIYADGTTINTSDAIYLMAVVKHSILSEDT